MSDTNSSVNNNLDFNKFNIDIALYRPEIPANTGNISRLCVGLSITLHIVDRPSFIMSNKEFRRAGLDYIEKLKLVRHIDEEEFIKYVRDNNKTVVPVSKFATTRYDNYNYNNSNILLFGRETSGLRESSFFSSIESTGVYIPMSDDVRSINLSNAAAVVSYEALRHIVLNNL